MLSSLFESVTHVVVVVTYGGGDTCGGDGGGDTCGGDGSGGDTHVHLQEWLYHLQVLEWELRRCLGFWRERWVVEWKGVGS